MRNITTWTTEGFGEADTLTLDLQRVDTLTYRNLAVPVWRLVPGQGNYHAGPFVRRDDLPADLAEAFFDRWQYGANQPFTDAAYHYDFESFMTRGGRAEDAEIVGRYR
ncbi:MAG: hypothetical protein ACYCTW_13540 [Sulfuricella sp.]